MVNNTCSRGEVYDWVTHVCGRCTELCMAGVHQINSTECLPCREYFNDQLVVTSTYHWSNFSSYSTYNHHILISPTDSSYQEDRIVTAFLIILTAATLLTCMLVTVVATAVYFRPSCRKTKHRDNITGSRLSRSIQQETNVDSSPLLQPSCVTSWPIPNHQTCFSAIGSSDPANVVCVPSSGTSPLSAVAVEKRVVTKTKSTLSYNSVKTSNSATTMRYSLLYSFRKLSKVCPFSILSTCNHHQICENTDSSIHAVEAEHPLSGSAAACRRSRSPSVPSILSLIENDEVDSSMCDTIEQVKETPESIQPPCRIAKRSSDIEKNRRVYVIPLLTSPMMWAPTIVHSCEEESTETDRKYSEIHGSSMCNSPPRSETVAPEAGDPIVPIADALNVRPRHDSYGNSQSSERTKDEDLVVENVTVRTSGSSGAVESLETSPKQRVDNRHTSSAGKILPDEIPIHESMLTPVRDAVACEASDDEISHMIKTNEDVISARLLGRNFTPDACLISVGKGLKVDSVQRDWVSRDRKVIEISTAASSSDGRGTDFLDLRSSVGKEATRKLFDWLDRQDWALDYHIDLYEKNAVVIGVHGIDHKQADRLIAESGLVHVHLHGSLPYVILTSSIANTQFVYCMMSRNHVDGQQPLNGQTAVQQQRRISLKSSTRIKVAVTGIPESSLPDQDQAQFSVVVDNVDKYSRPNSNNVPQRYARALLSGVVFDQNDRKYGFTVGHVFNDVNEVCRNEDDEEIGTCIARAMSMEPFFMDLALIQLVDVDCFTDENIVPRVGRDMAAAAAEREDVGCGWNLVLAQPEVDDDGLIRVIVLNKFPRWTRGVIKQINGNYKLLENGERKLFKNTMLITRSVTESVAVTEVGDSGAIVVQDPYRGGGARPTVSPSSYELRVYGIVTCVATDNSWTMSNKLVDTFEKIDDRMAKGWKLYKPFQNGFDSGFQI